MPQRHGLHEAIIEELALPRPWWHHIRVHIAAQATAGAALKITGPETLRTVRARPRDMVLSCMQLLLC